VSHLLADAIRFTLPFELFPPERIGNLQETPFRAVPPRTIRLLKMTFCWVIRVINTAWKVVCAGFAFRCHFLSYSGTSSPLDGEPNRLKTLE